MTVSRVSSPEVQLYTTHLPGYKRAYLDLFQLQAILGQEFVVKRVREYTIADLALDYNQNTPQGLEHSAISADSVPILRVGDYSVSLLDAKLRTYQGQVILDCKLGMAGKVKFVKQLKRFEVRLADHSPISSIETKRGSVLMTYRRTDHDEYPHRRIVVRAVGPATNVYVSTQPFQGKFRISSEVEGANGIYRVQADADATNYVSTKLESAIDLDDFRKTKGDIAEEMARQVLGEIGLEIVADHPFGREIFGAGSGRTGPDFLIRERHSGKLYYLEVKWWYQVENALVRASKQVLANFHKSPEFKGMKVQGAYVMLVDWSSENSEICVELRLVADF